MKPWQIGALVPTVILPLILIIEDSPTQRVCVKYHLSPDRVVSWNKSTFQLDSDVPELKQNRCYEFRIYNDRVIGVKKISGAYVNKTCQRSQK